MKESCRPDFFPTGTASVHFQEGSAAMSISAIAKLAGVSIATVSNVINDTGRVSPKTAARVRAVMKKQKLVLRPKRRHTPKRGARIAFCLADGTFSLENTTVIFKIIEGVQAVLEPLGCSLILPSMTTPDSIDRQVKDADAALVYGYEPDPQRLVEAAGKPVLWIMRYDCGTADAVMEDNRTLGVMVADHFFSRGHKRVGFIEDSRLEPVIERGVFMSRRLSELGAETVTVRDRFLFQSRHRVDEEKLFPLLRTLFKGRNRPSALFVPGDLMTVSVYAYMRDHGIKPMEDIDIVSCNKLDWQLDQLSPCPPVMDLKLREIGEMAATTVLWRIGHPDAPPVKLLVRPELINIPGSF